ncbi:MAG TPA: hypothetical protein VEA38_18935 [Terriglobales bacterium]|nr:hypothetical protein [Terriglobales bacterium]
MTLDPRTDAVLRRAVAGDGARRTVTLDPRLQGLPDTAHGGTVLALFDALAGARGPRVVTGTYRRRVPLGVPLALAVTVRDGATELALTEDGTRLVDGRVAPGERDAARESHTAAGEPDGARHGAAAPTAARDPLPLSRTCFVCGTDNTLGLQARLGIDADTVGGTWTPSPALAGVDGRLAPVALTGLLDEAAFWLGAAASGESGMTTELRVELVRAAPFGPVTVAGRRDAVHVRASDPRYWETRVTAWDDDGAAVARARITFVAVRGAARKLVAGLLGMNPPDAIRRVFPAYVR